MDWVKSLIERNKRRAIFAETRTGIVLKQQKTVSIKILAERDNRKTMMRLKADQVRILDEKVAAAMSKQRVEADYKFRCLLG